MTGIGDRTTIRAVPSTIRADTSDPSTIRSSTTAGLESCARSTRRILTPWSNGTGLDPFVGSCRGHLIRRAGTAVLLWDSDGSVVAPDGQEYNGFIAPQEHLSAVAEEPVEAVLRQEQFSVHRRRAVKGCDPECPLDEGDDASTVGLDQVGLIDALFLDVGTGHDLAGLPLGRSITGRSASSGPVCSRPGRRFGESLSSAGLENHHVVDGAELSVAGSHREVELFPGEFHQLPATQVGAQGGRCLSKSRQQGCAPIVGTACPGDCNDGRCRDRSYPQS